MNNWKQQTTKISLAWFWIAALGLMGAAGTGISTSSKVSPRYWTKEVVMLREKTQTELKDLHLWPKISKEILSNLFDYQSQTGYSLATILRDPVWAKQLGLNSSEFKGTWYAANPFDLLPIELQNAIRSKKEPFMTQHQVWEWFNSNHFKYSWRNSLKYALIETTPENLWRAGQGLRPYVKNGQFLEPIVFETKAGEFDVKNGHIATDPAYIPTNTEVFVIIKVKGEDRILKVKAADIGGSIKGKHVDLPIFLHSTRHNNKKPHINFPTEIRNPTVTVLSPLS